MIKIRNYEVNVDVEAELLQYEWEHWKVRGGKFLACSPFRRERHPSFAVNLDSGVWIDSGNDSDEWRKGHFIKLLSWLRNETWEETEEYLLYKYCPTFTGSVDSLTLTMKLELDIAVAPLPKDVLTPFLYRHPYLEKKRGIGERVQQAFIIGYDREKKAVAFPWFDIQGNLVNVKFRSIKSKVFWYIEGGQPIKNHIYGLHMVRKMGLKYAYIVESEIDALTLWQNRLPAIALGSANMTKAQEALIIQSGIQELIIATDNDKAGKRIAKSIVDRLNGYLIIKQINFPEEIKDVNEMTKEQLLEAVADPDFMTFTFNFKELEQTLAKY